MSVDANFVGIYGLNRCPCLLLPYYTENKMPMLFDVFGQSSALITVHSTQSDGRMYTSVHDEVNPNLIEVQKDFLIVYLQYVHLKIQCCQSFMRDKKYKT